jgi:hypothetical protein
LIDELLPALVEGEHPTLVALRAQLASLQVMRVELSGFGFHADFEVKGAGVEDIFPHPSRIRFARLQDALDTSRIRLTH